MIKFPQTDIHARSRPLTENERAWVEFIRLISFDSDPPPTLAHVQDLRQVLAQGVTTAHTAALP